MPRSKGCSTGVFVGQLIPLGEGRILGFSQIHRPPEMERLDFVNVDITFLVQILHVREDAIP